MDHNKLKQMLEEAAQRDMAEQKAAEKRKAEAHARSNADFLAAVEVYMANEAAREQAELQAAAAKRTVLEAAIHRGTSWVKVMVPRATRTAVEAVRQGSWALAQAAKTIGRPKVAGLPETVRQIGTNQIAIAIAPGIEMEFVRIPAGWFTMGSDKLSESTALEREGPQHRRYLPEYWMGKGPVMVGEFAAFVKATGHRTKAETDASNPSIRQSIAGADWAHPGGPSTGVEEKQRHPVTFVTWDDSVRFAEWATKSAGVKIELASGAEWEKAARGTDGRRYPWGDDKPDSTRANYGGDVGDTTEVGRYGARGASPFSCDDLAGNVNEWTRSKDHDGRCEKRGGWFSFMSSSLRCVSNSYSLPDSYHNSTGFRLIARLP